jgi:hypothetical protein
MSKRCVLNPNHRPRGRVVATELQSAKGPRIPCLAQPGTCKSCCPNNGKSRPTPTARVGQGCSSKTFYGSSGDGTASILNTAIAARTSTKADARGNQIQHLQVTGPNFCNRLLLAPGFVDVNAGAKAIALANATKCCSN